jgi:tetratricopeptide (TPR) repeat protein
VTGVPDPWQARSLAEFIGQLRALKVWVGDPSISEITRRVRQAWREVGRPESELPARATVGYCFQTGRSRPNPDLLLAIVAVLVGDDPATVERWRASLGVIQGEVDAAGQVSAADQLPADVADFTGRVELLDRAGGLLEDARANGTAAVVVFDGMAGIGKTALAGHLAHRLLAAGTVERVLTVDLRGYDPDRPPADPAAVLTAFLRLLGVPGERVPAAPDKRAARYRQVVGTAKTLILLDNAAAAEQVLPLLPGTPTCPVLVTARTALAGLPDAYHLPVPQFSPAEAGRLLRRIAGAGRIAADPDAAAHIAELVGHLPLGLSVIGVHLRDHPDWALADYPAALTALALEGGVRAALALSDAGLAPAPRRLLRLLTLHPGADLDRYAAAALAGHSLAATGDLLAALRAAKLLQEERPGRYSLHDLIRAYAVDRAVLDHPRSELDRAVSRLLDHYAATAARAAAVAYPHEPIDPGPDPSGPAPDVGTEAEALAWLDREQSNLLEAARYAARRGLGAHTLRLSGALHRHLRTRGAYAEADALHRDALDVARAGGDRVAELTALNQLGNVSRLLGRCDDGLACHAAALELARAGGVAAAEVEALTGIGFVHYVQARREPAVEHLTSGLAAARAAGHITGEIDALTGLGYLHYAAGEYQPALDCHGQALALARAAGHRIGTLYALIELSHVHRALADYPAAVGHLDEAVDLARAVGSRDGEMNVLISLGLIHLLQRRPEQAAGCFAAARELARATGNPLGELGALTGLGRCSHAQGRHPQAVSQFGAVLDLARSVGDRNWQCEAHLGLGSTHQAAGRYDAARSAHQQAVDLARQLDQPADEARGLHGLARAEAALGDPAQARRSWRQALRIVTGLGTDSVDELTADDIRAHLARLPAATSDG